MKTLEQIKELPPKEALTVLNEFLAVNINNEEAYIMRGRIYWNLNKRKEAITDYLAAIKINPESNANMLLQYAYSILDFYNKDLLNP